MKPEKPTEGLVIFDTKTCQLIYYDGMVWRSVATRDVV